MVGADGRSVGAGYFNYWTLFTLALIGGILGVLMMVPLRRALIVKEHAWEPDGYFLPSVIYDEEEKIFKAWLDGGGPGDDGGARRQPPSAIVRMSCAMSVFFLPCAATAFS